MNENMTQDEVNQAEWENPANWSGWKLTSKYSSEKDNRTWVPKQIPSLGKTINLARTGDPGKKPWVIAIFSVVVLVCIIVIVAALI